MSVLMCSVMVETAPCPAGPGCQNADKLGDVPLLGVGGEQQQQQTVAAAPDALKSQQQAACIVADADASVDVSSVITQYLGPTTHDAAVAAANAKWQEEVGVAGCQLQGGEGAGWHQTSVAGRKRGHRIMASSPAARGTTYLSLHAAAGARVHGISTTCCSLPRDRSDDDRDQLLRPRCHTRT